MSPLRASTSPYTQKKAMSSSNLTLVLGLPPCGQKKLTMMGSIMLLRRPETGTKEYLRFVTLIEMSLIYFHILF